MDKINAVLDWIKRNRALIGVVLTVLFGVMQGHVGQPVFDMSREFLGWVSGMLLGAGIFNSDDIARFKQGKLSNIAVTLGPATVPISGGKPLTRPVTNTDSIGSGDKP